MQTQLKMAVIGGMLSFTLSACGDLQVGQGSSPYPSFAEIDAGLASYSEFPAGPSMSFSGQYWTSSDNCTFTRMERADGQVMYNLVINPVWVGRPPSGGNCPTYVRPNIAIVDAEQEILIASR